MNGWSQSGDSTGWVAIYSNTTTPVTEDERMPVYEYLVVYTGDDGFKGARVLVGPKISLAADEEVVKMEAAREIPAEYADKLDDVDIHVRKWEWPAA